MRTLGLIGGTGWPSSLEYYRLLNEEVNRRLGGYEAARCILYSLNFGDVMRAKAGDPDQVQVGEMVAEAATRLASAGADGLMLCANTLHVFTEKVERAAPVPLVHIARATAARVRAEGVRRVGLLGTRQTMERGFYRTRLEETGLEVLVPGEAARARMEHAIYEELVLGVFRDETRRDFLRIMAELRERGAQGFVLGCTELPLLLTQDHSELPLFDTLRLHVEAGVDFALS